MALGVAEIPEAPNIWAVSSGDPERAPYLVRLAGGVYTCTCPSHRFGARRDPHFLCKHSQAVAIYRLQPCPQCGEAHRVESAGDWCIDCIRLGTLEGERLGLRCPYCDEAAAVYGLGMCRGCHLSALADYRSFAEIDAQADAENAARLAAHAVAAVDFRPRCGRCAAVHTGPPAGDGDICQPCTEAIVGAHIGPQGDPLYRELLSVPGLLEMARREQATRDERARGLKVGEFRLLASVPPGWAE